jgi:tRNA G18 (ribose-2'-O)-methylase SpoU
MYVILHNVRSAHNVGSIFRTAEAAGVKRIYLSGYTPDPIDRFGRDQSEIAKTSLGASKLMPWEHVNDLTVLIKDLKAGGVLVVAVEQDKHAVPHHTQEFERNTAYIFGNEVEGIPQDILSLADVVIDVPMYGKKESLNVSVCAGVILFNTPRRQ